MKILEVSRYKSNFATHILPFVKEQGDALLALDNDVEYHTVAGKGLFSYFTGIPAVQTVIRKFQPDIVHAHYGLSGVTAVLAVRLLRRQIRPKVVITFHNGETLNWYVNLLSSFFSLFADHVIYVAQHIRDLCYFKAKHYTILPCGVSLDELPLTDFTIARQQLNWSDNKKYILFGGAFENTRKNVALLREALALLKRNDVEVVEMKGMSRAECALRMCACDLFALPTHSEGSPQALKEAMACNCPIVATDVADIAYLLGDMQGHYLLRNPRPTKERWDADEHSVDELAQLLDKALQQNSRTEGRKRIVELGLENKQIAQKLMDIYTDLITKA